MPICCHRLNETFYEELDWIKGSLLIIVWAVVFYPVYPGLMGTWFGTSNADNSYGILVPFISLLFIWKKKEALQQAGSSISTLGLIILMASLLFYVVSLAGGVVFPQRLMMVISLNGLIYIYGKEIFQIVRFPLVFLLFYDSHSGIRVLSMVSFPLQTYATIISAKIIQLCGIPVYREGHMLYFAQTQLEVAEACSGIHSISALLMLSVIFMHQCENSRTRKTIIILSSVVIAFIANIFRVSGTGILAHFYGAGPAGDFYMNSRAWQFLHSAS